MQALKLTAPGVPELAAMLAGCQFNGLNSLNMPGTKGHGPGSYTVTLAHPSAAEPVTCQVELVTGQVVTCQQELVPVDVMQYFKEAGWWQ